MMNQAVLFHFAIQKNDRVYQFQVQPGAPWEEIQATLDEMKAEFVVLQQQAEKAAAEKNEVKPEEAQAPVEAELVS